MEISCYLYLQLREQARNVKNYSPDSKELIVKGVDLVYTRLYVVAAYVLLLLLYPFSNCSRTTRSFEQQI